MTLSVEDAEALVEKAQAGVHEANDAYIKACRDLFRAKVQHARANPHPWHKQAVYRIMGGGAIKSRSEHGIVRFKDIGEEDFGNPHIPFGSYYVLIDGKRAAFLDGSWILELL